MKGSGAYEQNQARRVAQTSHQSEENGSQAQSPEGGWHCYHNDSAALMPRFHFF